MGYLIKELLDLDTITRLEAEFNLTMPKITTPATYYRHYEDSAELNELKFLMESNRGVNYEKNTY